VRERRTNKRRSAGRRAGIVGEIAGIWQWLWAKATHRPIDSMAILGAGAVSLVIIVNAVFLQSGPHPTPFFANPTSQPPAGENRSNIAVTAMSKPAETAPARPMIGQRLPQPQPVSARRNDPIADLIGSSVGPPPARVAAVQRVLAEFGYGQVKPSGIVDEATSAAIGKFESDRKLPVTGRLSDRLLSELATMTGHPIE